MSKVEENFQELKDLISSTLTGAGQDSYLRLLSHLEEDQIVDGELLLGFKRAPAAKGNHHAFEGGLVVHYLEMWNWWKTLKTNIGDHEQLSDDKILRGIINHDIHKAYRTFKISDEGTFATYANDPSDNMTNHVSKSQWVLSNSGVTMELEVLNALLLSEGGWSTVKTRWSSVLAKVVYLLDELSGNVQERIRLGTWDNVRVVS